MEALTLYELNGLVRGTLERTLQAEYWLQAELSEVREAYNGHCYLEFVQKSVNGRDLVAKARGVIWAGMYRLLKPMFERETGRTLSPGLKVLVKVGVTFHELYGYIALRCRTSILPIRWATWRVCAGRFWHVWRRTAF